jgi:hypothetical protein
MTTINTQVVNIENLNIYANISNEKYCHRCNVSKNISEFGKNKTKGDGLQSYCKLCMCKTTTEYNRNNKDIIKEKSKEHYEKNKDIIKEKSKEYYENNKDHAKEYYKNNKKKISDYNLKYNKDNKEKKSDYNLKYYKDNKEKKSDYNLKYSKKKYHEDEIYRTKNILRSRIYLALKGKLKSAKTLELLGCQIDMFLNWLEYNFTSDMNWKNRGSYWEIDHVRACATFNLQDPEQQKICFNWRNQSPLRKDKNRSKGAKRNPFAELMQELKVVIYLKNREQEDR